MIVAVAIAKRRSKKSRRRGSIKGHTTIWQTSTYPLDKFQMNSPLFLRIKNYVKQHDSYFVQKKIISDAMQMIAYGVSVDFIDEYVRIGKSTAIESLKKLVRPVFEIFSNEYLRSPNTNDIARLLAEGEQRGFPG
ncbi:hypothetical protein CISIN_1g042019mg, partial [Citrus sinensis]